MTESESVALPFGDSAIYVPTFRQHMLYYNIFFNNAKRIIERSSGEERKNALILELENPFFEPKTPQQSKARIIRMFGNGVQKDDWITRTYKTIENKINQFRFYRMSA